MKNKIAKIIWFNKDEIKATEEILDLLKQEGWKSPEDIPGVEKGGG